MLHERLNLAAVAAVRFHRLDVVEEVVTDGVVFDMTMRFGHCVLLERPGSGLRGDFHGETL